MKMQENYEAAYAYYTKNKAFCEKVAETMLSQLPRFLDKSSSKIVFNVPKTLDIQKLFEIVFNDYKNLAIDTSIFQGNIFARAHYMQNIRSRHLIHALLDMKEEEAEKNEKLFNRYARMMEEGLNNALNMLESLELARLETIDNC